jgi:hypothetical protein
VALSRPWLEDYARSVPPGTSESMHDPRWVGLFLVDGTEEHQGAVVLYTSHSWINRHGVMYDPSGAQRPPKFRNVAPLVGDWYRFEWKF